ncbi:hypothetical protein, variant [Aphanomyces invadans]|uniref:Tetratricopeptide repeat protein 26 n=1 Tax=Aphanomyces invadans TaxID=157072 RepID=A0A024TSC7_9STRA|nr:hypothetical protein, variant [Aphanomyces invadans]ETV97060.1 hypothetical protein, variant [Aphanomyces invadans]|eukprot:XP_008874306.1 hypothetical protein, variant [Aphanomyces invadans]
MIKASSKPHAAKAAPKNAMDMKKRRWLLETYLDSRDYTGAMTLLRFQAKHGERSRLNTLWTAYCLFHMGEYMQALRHYEEVLKRDEEERCADPSQSNPVMINIACCYLYLRYFDLAKNALAQVIEPDAAMADAQQRLRLLLAQRTKDTGAIHSLLYEQSSTVSSQLASAAVLFHERNFQGAVDIYKRLLARHESHAAVHVYLAMCYYHLEYYDISSEMLATYLSAVDAHSMVARNLAACNTFHLVDGMSAEKSLNLRGDQRGAAGHALVEHNLVVFRDGELALRLWPALVDTVAEAQLNLALFHIKHDKFDKAYDMLDAFEPAQPIEYIVKAIVHMWMGQQQAEGVSQVHRGAITPNNEHLFLSEKYFETVGAASTECDTIRGRQAMASLYLLRKEFATALVYLKSIAMYHVHDDTFNWNYGVALAATGGFSEGENVLGQVQNPQWRQEYTYLAWLARCHIRSIKQSQLAWDLYLKVKNSTDALQLLKLIANEYYLMADYFYAAKAFDVLERVDPDPEFWEAKRGACIGYFHKASLPAVTIQRAMLNGCI